MRYLIFTFLCFLASCAESIGVKVFGATLNIPNDYTVSSRNNSVYFSSNSGYEVFIIKLGKVKDCAKCNKDYVGGYEAGEKPGFFYNKVEIIKGKYLITLFNEYEYIQFYSVKDFDVEELWGRFRSS